MQVITLNTLPENLKNRSLTLSRTARSFYDSVYDYCMFKWTFSSNTIPFFQHYTDAIIKRGLCRQQAPKGGKRGGERKWMWYKKKLNFPWSPPLYTLLATTVPFTVFPKKPCDLPPPPPQKKKKERKRKFLLRNLIRNKVQKLWNDCFTDMLHETKILEFPGAPKD